MYQVDFNHPVHVYFIGIGGISMSGLAEILLSEGFRVSGSDMKKSSLTELLEKEGAVKMCIRDRPYSDYPANPIPAFSSGKDDKASRHVHSNIWSRS